MALTQELLDQIEADRARQSIYHRLELVRIAKETLVENDRSKPADERGVSSEAITSFAESMYAYISQ